MPVAVGLRARLLVTVGLVTVALMVLLSWGMLYSWRRSLVRQEVGNALAVSRAFSVAVTDALILADQDLTRSEGFLDTYVDLFMARNPRLRAITILDQGGAVVARSWERGGPPWVSGAREDLVAATEPATTITPLAEGPWVLETVLPLYTGERRWGVLVLDVEADSIRDRIRRTFFQLALFSVATASVMLLILWLMLSRILGSLQTLVGAMDQLDIHALPEPELPRRQDEIGILYDRFRLMQRRVDQSRRELLAAQHQVWHAERLAAIGRLASGLAHEINNPVNGIRSCIYAIRNAPDDREQTAEYLEMMDEGLTQVSSVLDKLLGFARRQQAAFGPVDVAEAVDSVVRLVAYDAGRKDVGLEARVADGTPTIRADRQLLLEVVMNLLLNAVDASEAGGRVELDVRPDGAGVELLVSDRGHGIAPEIADRIFDPFFTTKKANEGTGLGLSICLGIVQAHGGALAAAPREGGGTVFRVTLPADPPGDRAEETP